MGEISIHISTKKKGIDDRGSRHKAYTHTREPRLARGMVVLKARPLASSVPGRKSICDKKPAICTDVSRNSRLCGKYIAAGEKDAENRTELVMESAKYRRPNTYFAR